MNYEINETLTKKSSSRPELIPAPAKELLNLRRLPAMLNMAQTAAMLGLAEHDIPVLVRAGQLKPLGNPPPNAVKAFATVQVMELAGEIAVLNKIRNTSMNTGAGRTPAGTVPYPSHDVFLTGIGELASLRAIKKTQPENSEGCFRLIFICPNLPEDWRVLYAIATGDTASWRLGASAPPPARPHRQTSQDICFNSCHHPAGQIGR